MSKLLYLLLILHHQGIDSSFESEIDMFSFPNRIEKVKPSKDDLNVPEWLQNITTEAIVSKYRKRRFLSLGSTLRFAFEIKIPGFDIFGAPTTYAVKPSFFFRIPAVMNIDARSFDFLNRTHLFKEIEAIFDAIGFDGKSCILRTICELSVSPFNHGLIGEIVNFLFLVSNEGEHIEDNLIAETVYPKVRLKRDNSKEDCASFYHHRKCPFSLLNFISDIE